MTKGHEPTLSKGVVVLPERVQVIHPERREILSRTAASS
jgi:hypothetical protein